MIPVSPFLKNSHITCPECQVGTYQLKLVTYYTYLGAELITVPDFPCWVCDVCKRFEYDQKAINQISLVLHSNLGQPVEKGRKGPAKQITRPRPGRTSQVE
jgi:YgiT-type zinc finger domain-containing protein